MKNSRPPRSGPPAMARSGTGRKAGTAWRSLPAGAEPVETRRGLPGDPEDTHSRYIEAAIGGLIVGCLYLPNGNPAPGPKFDYKLRWFERLTELRRDSFWTAARRPFWPATSTSCRPISMSMRRSAGSMTPCSGRRCATPIAAWSTQGWTDALRALHPDERIYTFWNYFRNAFARDAGLRIDHSAAQPRVAERLVAAGVDRDVRGREKASDHAPTWVEFVDAESTPRRRRTDAQSTPCLVGRRSGIEVFHSMAHGVVKQHRDLSGRGGDRTLLLGASPSQEVKCLALGHEDRSSPHSAINFSER